MNDIVIRQTVSATARAEATASAIVETAEGLFRTLGYQKTTVADIARALRMSPANVYRFYASKSAINEAVCARITTHLQERAWAVARGPGTPEERLRRLYEAMQRETISLFFKDKKMHDMVAAALGEHWSVIDAHIQQIDRALRHIIMDGQADGVFARADAETTAKLVHMTMVAFSHPVVVEQCQNHDDLPAQAAGMAELVLRALRRNSLTDGS